MKENTQESEFIRLLKKIWPFINRVVNTSFYFIMSLIKGIAKGISDQIKGSM
jgi:hypothetical protein